MTRAATNFHTLEAEDAVGSLFDDATGRIDEEQLKAMWRQHAEDYRDQLDGHCGLNGETLTAFHGATVADGQLPKMLLERRPILLLRLEVVALPLRVAQRWRHRLQGGTAVVPASDSRCVTAEAACGTQAAAAEA